MFPVSRQMLACLSLLALLTLPLGASAETTRVLSLEQVRAKLSERADLFAEVEGVNVHYRDEGQGPPILLIHGTFGELRDWDEWTRILAPAYRVIRLDLPGAGMTGPMASGNYSADRMLSLIDAFMDQLGIERFAIAGISYGGLVAFRYAATRVERVSALILANSAGIEFGGRGGTGTRTTNVLPYNMNTDASVTRANVETTLKYVINDPTRITDGLIERKLAFANIVGRAQEGLAGTAAYERGNPQRVLAHVRAPALILWGSGNQALSNQTAGAFAAALKNASRVEQRMIPDAGHMLNVDKPEPSAAAVAEFLATVLKQK